MPPLSILEVETFRRWRSQEVAIAVRGYSRFASVAIALGLVGSCLPTAQGIQLADGTVYFAQAPEPVEGNNHV